MGKINEQCKAVKELFVTRKDHGLDINLCIKFVTSFIFTGVQRVKIRLFYKTV